MKTILCSLLAWVALYPGSLWAKRQVVMLVDPDPQCQTYAFQKVLPELKTLAIGDGMKLWQTDSPRSILSMQFRRNPYLDLEPVFVKNFKRASAPTIEILTSGIPDAEAVLAGQLAEKYYPMARQRSMPTVDLIFVSQPFLLY